MSVQPLAGRLRAGEPLRMLFVKMPAAAQVEIAGEAGFDAIVLDTEHGPSGATLLEEHVRAADAASLPALVRVASLDPAAILQALDAGAAGIVVPHVRDAADAAAAAAAAHYPPLGRRGIALSTRAGRYGSRGLADHLRRAGQETVVVVQIEDAEAVPRAAEILATPRVDGVLIGTADLSLSLGHPGALSHPEVAGAVGAIRAAAAEARCAVASVVADPAEAEAARAAGSSVVVFVATGLMLSAFRSAAGHAASSAPGRPELVLLPGMLGTAALWDDVAAGLVEHAAVRVARIDLDDSVEAAAASVLAAAPSRFALAGHSLGAIVALAVARTAPGRVTRLALLNASARGPSEAQLDAWAGMRERAETGSFAELAHEFAVANLPPARREDAALLARVEAMALEVGPRGLLRELAAQVTRPESRPSLGTIAAPTLVVSGTEDTVCPPALQEELAAGIPGARLARLDGIGHMSPLEAPAAVARLLGDWLA